MRICICIIFPSFILHNRALITNPGKKLTKRTGPRIAKTWFEKSSTPKIFYEIDLGGSPGIVISARTKSFQVNKKDRRRLHVLNFDYSETHIL